jgi:hypothetical protein
MKLEIAEERAQFISDIEVAGRSFAVLSWIRIRAKDVPRVPHVVEFVIELQDRGFVCTALEVKQRPDGPPVTLAGIRSIPVESLVRQSIEALVLERLRETTPGSTRLRFGGPHGLPVQTRRRSTKRRSPDEEAADVELAAVVHRLAEVCGEPPTKAVADQLRIPLGTARFLVARAVKRGLLQPRTQP